MRTIDDFIRDEGLDPTVVNTEMDALRNYIEVFNLAEARKMAGLTQTEVGKRMGVSQKRISEIETGSIDSVRAGTLRRYAAALGARIRFQLEYPMPDGEIRILNMPYVPNES